MGHRKAALLALCTLLALCALAGCGKKAGDDGTAAAQVTPAPTEVPQSFAVLDGTDAQAAASQAKTDIAGRLDLPEGAADQLETVSVTRYEDETVVRCAQTWRGVEVYGSSLVNADGGDGYSAGTYYDLTGAFGDDFDALAAQAAAVPDWMTDCASDRVSLVYDRSTLKPVIFITQSGQAVLARSVRARFTVDGEGVDIDMVLALDGPEVYTYAPIDQAEDFTDVAVEGYDMSISEENGIFYAYNSKYNFYAIDATNSSRKVKELAKEYSSYDSYLRRRKVELNKKIMYHRADSNWANAESRNVLTMMEHYYRVAAWYAEQYGWYGLNGNNTPSAILIKDEPGSLAVNYSDAIVYVRPEVGSAPEVLAHEYAHSIFHSLTQTPDPTDECAAINEAVCDTFAALFLGDGSWKLAVNTSQPKDIPAKRMTMNDYRYDTYLDAKEAGADMNAIDWYLYFVDGVYALEDLAMDKLIAPADWTLRVHAEGLTSTTRSHENSFIISNLLYRIWFEQYSKDNETFGRVLFRSLRYMPVNGDCSDFREAFLRAAAACGGSDQLIDRLRTYFDEALIPASLHMSSISAWVREASQEMLSGPSVLDYFDMTYDQLGRQTWDSFDYTDSPDDPDSWWCFASQGTLSYTFTYYYTPMGLPDARPWGVSVYALAGPGETAQNVTITPGVSTGMTYEQVSAKVGAPWPGDDYEYGENISRYQSPDGYQFILFFDGAAASSKLYGAVIWAPAGE